MNAPHSDEYLSDEAKKDHKSKDDLAYVRRGPWSHEEDRKLMDIITQCGPLNWVRISVMLGSRSPKQCRERYHQNLKPLLNREPITYEEGLLIEELVAKNGKKWAEIARHLTGRSDNAIKNWWNGGANRRRRVAQVPNPTLSHANSPSPPRASGKHFPVSRENLPAEASAGYGGYMLPSMGHTLASSNRRPLPINHDHYPQPLVENSYIDLKNRSLTSGNEPRQGFSGQPALPKIDSLPMISFKTSMFMTPANNSTNTSFTGTLLLPGAVASVGRLYSIDHSSLEAQSVVNKRRLAEERRHSATHSASLPPLPAFYPSTGPFANHAVPSLLEHSEAMGLTPAGFRNSGLSASSSDDLNNGSFTHHIDMDSSYRRAWAFPSVSHSLTGESSAKKAQSHSPAEPTPRTSDGESDTSTENKAVPAVRMKVSSLIN